MDQLERKQRMTFVLQEEAVDDDLAYRHSYHEEQLLMQAVREGHGKEAVSLAVRMDEDAGRLSTKETAHWKNLAIIGIALCARAAIEGGVTPEEAYRLSGFYIRKCDECTSADALREIRDTAIGELCEQVLRHKGRPQGIGYVHRAKEYIQNHYREKLYLEDIADHVGISPSYLSRLFKQETGVRLQDYINEERVYRASNLLLYSDLTLSEISQYVHFPNQSYFGKIFKQYKNMTPKEYREWYKTYGSL